MINPIQNKTVKDSTETTANPASNIKIAENTIQSSNAPTEKAKPIQKKVSEGSVKASDALNIVLARSLGLDDWHFASYEDLETPNNFQPANSIYQNDESYDNKF